MKLCALVILLGLCASTGRPAEGGVGPLTGDLTVHDPSTIVPCKGQYWVFATGWGLISRFSTNLVDWQTGPRVFSTFPTWMTNAVPGNRGHLWAPDVIYLNGQYWLYYSVSTWGSQTSAVGLATSPTLDPADPAYGWTDRGIVIQTSRRNNFNAIDPSVLLDRNGKLWMALGSYWSGIKLLELDPKTGKRVASDSPIYPLAWHESIEAACLCQRGDYYYLFVNWGQCCRGTNSTYNIRIGRSRVATGPYVDRDGADLMSGGGTLLLASAGRYIGPGHAGIVNKDGADWLSFHYYDGDRRGAKTLEIRPLRWSADGWPEVGTR